MNKPELVAHLRQEHHIDVPEADVMLDWLALYHSELHEEQGYQSAIPDAAWDELLRATRPIGPDTLARWAEEDRTDLDAKRWARGELG